MQEAASVFAALDRELWLLTATTNNRRGGLIATSVSPAALSPQTPRILVGVGKQHHTWQLIESSGAFALHLLAESQLDWVWRFGLHSGRNVDKLEGLLHRQEVTGSPILDGVPGWLDCRVEERLDTGDRTVYLAEVVAAHSESGRVLTMKRLLELAPADRLQELKQTVARDRDLEAAAIRAWREQRQG